MSEKNPCVDGDEEDLLTKVVEEREPQSTPFRAMRPKSSTGQGADRSCNSSPTRDQTTSLPLSLQYEEKEFEDNGKVYCMQVQAVRGCVPLIRASEMSA